MENHEENGERRKNGQVIKWDGKINVPTIIVVLVFLGGAWKFTADMSANATKAVDEVVKINLKMDEQGKSFDARMDKFQDSITAIQLTLATHNGLAVKVDDHESRLRAIEGKR